MKKSRINPAGVVKPISSYSHAVRIAASEASLIFVAGQVALDVDGKLVGEGDFTKQTEFVFRQIETILKASGASLDDIVKSTVFVTDVENFPSFTAVRNRVLARALPANSLVEVSALAVPGALIEIEVIAAVKA